ncbi:putative signal peptide protein [Botrytis fragariae]|uniref:Putative signal peptide protein n=1 Tax=Botrytis fragariae TaxID=1964551 RepID=A0A8H6ATU6_9HELO|nr:putative signal peptide protein [Botrytis fragariae]KAF5873290.1 putative signal peptide protein [Botrytis fragariae]
MDNVKDLLAKYGSMIYTHREMIKLEIHVILAALFPIYIGSHASLQRPPSASPPRKSSSSNRLLTSDEEDEEESRAQMEGMTPSDAIIFPLLAAVALGSLYFIIKWLDDPAILNKILGCYFSALGIFGVGRLAKDSLDVGVGFIFPNVWTRGNNVFHIDQKSRRQVSEDGQGKLVSVGIVSPLPGRLSKINLPKGVTNALWDVRGLLRTNYTLHLHIKTILPHQKSPIKFTSLLGLLIGIATITAYNLMNAPWYLTNLMGFGFCYGSLQLMSLTTFFTGSLVLFGLFFYDIIMVFYTPLMVTVATTLDVPIKLVFPAGESGRGSMLGLGDIVLPGILVALALRFDLYLHYLYLQKPNSSTVSPATTSKKALTKVSTTPIPSSQKPAYRPATGLWGERFWTASFSPLSSSSLKTGVEGTRFPKPYFKAALAGYIIGMLVTLFVMNVWKHAQPALLYLVPGVVFSLWGTAAVRGELRVMWEFTEDGSLEDEGKKDEEEKKIEGEKKKVDEKKDDEKVKEKQISNGEVTKKEQKHEEIKTKLAEAIGTLMDDSDASSVLSDGSISWPEDNGNANASEADDELVYNRSEKEKHERIEKTARKSLREKEKKREKEMEDQIFLFSITGPGSRGAERKGEKTGMDGEGEEKKKDR